MTCLVALAGVSPAAAQTASPSADPTVDLSTTELAPVAEPVPTEEAAPEGVLAKIVHYAEILWNYQLFTSGDKTVHLNQVIIAILVLLVGLLVCRWISAVVRQRLEKISRLDRNTAQIIQNITFYTLLALVALIALPIAGIPITVFTVIGGALAIGIGFGAQNLCNNFISNLILMSERPIRVGDVVEVDGELGQVERIGGRCTLVNRSDGVDVLVPNSRFLENTLINWTLTSPIVRSSVKVGVAYGSPTRRVHELIDEILAENEKVLDDPPPFVIFEDFGDSSLVFEAYFWAEARRPMDLRRVASELRHTIDQRLRNESIVIAFPQRDVHVDSLAPLRVQLEDGHDPTADSPVRDEPAGGERSEPPGASDEDDSDE
ncbi:MAG: mechanosensitive ion channel [Phycisphaeraceae bacterium]|nr:mechanosensitive ion channel [Phycisphaeraceae bacterium]